MILSQSAAVSVQSLSKTFGHRVVLDQVTLDLAPGEIYGLFGSNGCGKSTLLRIIAGAMLPTQGSVFCNGAVGYVAQKFSLYSDLSVEENLTFFAQCQGLHGADARARVHDALARFDLQPWRCERAGVLSHGWRQRLAIASAVCHSPSILLLDEATAGIDPEGRAGVWQILEDYARSGVAILSSTHYSEDVERCHRIGYLDRGKLSARTPRMMREAG